MKKNSAVVFIICLFLIFNNVNAKPNFGDAIYGSWGLQVDYTYYAMGNMEFNSYGMGVTGINDYDYSTGQVKDYNIPHDNYILEKNKRIGPKVGLDLTYSYEILSNLYLIPGFGIYIQRNWDLAHSNVSHRIYKQSGGINIYPALSTHILYFFGNLGIGAGYNSQGGPLVAAGFKF
ncbi:MAG: hypothetical protein ACOCP4_07470 [Candidatus Woesearchaeota archaeon]